MFRKKKKKKEKTIAVRNYKIRVWGHLVVSVRKSGGRVISTVTLRELKKKWKFPPTD